MTPKFISIAGITVLLIALLVVGLVLGLKSRNNKSDAGGNTPADMFNDISDTPDKIGGLLTHLMSHTDFEAILAQPEFSFGVNSSGVADCAAAHRHTCSAWTYLRKDLPPMLYIFPASPEVSGFWTPNVGILVDPAKMWPLLTTMGVIDSATNERSCCSNEDATVEWLADSYSDDPSSNQFAACAKEKGYGDKWYLYSSLGMSGPSCPRSCKPDDEICRAVNSGGGANFLDMSEWIGESSLCDCIPDKDHITQPSAADKKNYDFSGWDGYTPYAFEGKCLFCNKPYFCDTDASKKPGTYAVTSDGPRAYVGPQGDAWVSMFGGTKEKIADVSVTMTTHCKWQKSNWPQWINALHDYYNLYIEGLNNNNDYYDKSRSYLQANPCGFSYYENEVNAYIPPPGTPEEKTTDDTFRDSILGFIYIASTCEEQLAPLNGTTSICEPSQCGSPAAQCTYKNAADRCNGFLCKSKTGTCKNIAELAARKVKAKAATIEMVKKFNETYRQGAEQIKGYACTPASNVFMDKKMLQDAANGQIKYENVFQEISM